MNFSSTQEYLSLNRLRFAAVGGAVTGAVITLMTLILARTQAHDFATFFIILALLGMMGFMQKISIIPHPEHVLMGTLFFAILTAIVDTLLF